MKLPKVHDPKSLHMAIGLVFSGAIGVGAAFVANSWNEPERIPFDPSKEIVSTDNLPNASLQGAKEFVKNSQVIWAEQHKNNIPVYVDLSLGALQRGETEFDFDRATSTFYSGRSADVYQFNFAAGHLKEICLGNKIGCVQATDLSSGEQASLREAVCNKARAERREDFLQRQCFG